MYGFYQFYCDKNVIEVRASYERVEGRHGHRTENNNDLIKAEAHRLNIERARPTLVCIK